MTLSRGRKLVFTVVLFVLAIGVVGLASGTHRGSVLFLAWIPLLAAAWVLTRPEPGMEPPQPAESVAAPALEEVPSTEASAEPEP
jgi:hypothetical protein